MTNYILKSGLFGNQALQQSRSYLSSLGSFASPAAALQSVQSNFYQQQLIQSIQQVASDQLESNTKNTQRISTGF